MVPIQQAFSSTDQKEPEFLYGISSTMAPGEMRLSNPSQNQWVRQIREASVAVAAQQSKPKVIILKACKGPVTSSPHYLAEA
jgi:hypothetical protein